MVFKLISSESAPATRSLLEVKACRLKDKTIIQVIDISSTITQEFDQQKANNEVLNVINACVSHELRNPLNSISAQNFMKKILYRKLRAIEVNDPIAKKAIDEILDELDTGASI